MIWSDYVDESYNPQTFCVGGLLAPVDMWPKIERSWDGRILRENRISAKRGFPPISRYHATDCANLKREFSKENGWTIERQIRFSKRLCKVIASNGPCAIVHGGSLPELKQHIPGDPNGARDFLYHISIFMHLIMVGTIMNQQFPKSKVAVYYDRNKQFGRVAGEVFQSFMEDPTAKDISKYFISMAPLGWEDCIALQLADFIAYEGMKRLDGHLRGDPKIRKSLQALLGDSMPIRIESFTDQNFADIVKMVMNKRKGAPLSDGVHSKLDICVDQ